MSLNLAPFARVYLCIRWAPHRKSALTFSSAYCQAPETHVARCINPPCRGSADLIQSELPDWKKVRGGLSSGLGGPNTFRNMPHSSDQVGVDFCLRNFDLQFELARGGNALLKIRGRAKTVTCCGGSNGARLGAH